VTVKLTQKCQVLHWSFVRNIWSSSHLVFVRNIWSSSHLVYNVQRFLKLQWIMSCASIWCSSHANYVLSHYTLQDENYACIQCRVNVKCTRNTSSYCN
jgi:hypothetical protein